MEGYYINMNISFRSPGCAVEQEIQHEELGSDDDDDDEEEFEVVALTHLS